MRLNKKLEDFLKLYLPVNSFWISAVVLAAYWFHNPWTIILLLALGAFLFVDFQRTQDTKPFFIQRNRKIIDRLYMIGFWGFLGITFITSYLGFNLVSGLKPNEEHSLIFAVVALLLTATLACMAYIAKSRRSPKIVAGAVLLYLVFDFLVALPFNWLFFFNVYKGIDNVGRDKKIFDRAIQICENDITPRFNSIKDSCMMLQNTITAAYEKAHLDAVEQDDAARRTLINLASNGSANARDSVRLSKSAVVKIPKEYSSLKERYDTRFRIDSVAYYGYSLALDSVKEKFKTVDKLTKDSAAICAQDIKYRLRYLLTSLNDTASQGIFKQLEYAEPTPLETIMLLRKFVFGEEGDTQTKTYNELIKMALSTSIIIDILPLLISLLYARYERED